MLRLGKNKIGIAPITNEDKDSEDKTTPPVKLNTGAVTSVLNSERSSSSSEPFNIHCVDELNNPIKEFKLDPKTLLLDLNSLPIEHTKEYLRLYKIPEFGTKYSATIVHYVYKMDQMIDEMVIQLYPIMSQFMPNLTDEQPIHSLSAAVHGSYASESQHQPSSSSVSSAAGLIPKLSEINCCLWIIQESLVASLKPTRSTTSLNSHFLLHKANHKLSLKRLGIGLKSLKPVIKRYLHKWKNIQQITDVIQNNMKSDFKRFKLQAKEHYKKYLINCKPDSLRGILLNRIKSTEGDKLMKFNCSPVGYTIICQNPSDIAACAGAGDNSWSSLSHNFSIRPLPTKLQPEILFNIIRELEYRIHKAINEIPAILCQKLLKSNIGGFQEQLGYLLHLDRFHELTLSTNSAVAILFAFKRVTTKMELFKELLTKFLTISSLVRKRINQLHKNIGKTFYQCSKSAKLAASAAPEMEDIDIENDLVNINNCNGYGGLSEQMLRFSRMKLIKIYDKLEITLFTSWPQCFHEYIIVQGNDQNVSWNMKLKEIDSKDHNDSKDKEDCDLKEIQDPADSGELIKGSSGSIEK